MAKKKIIVKRVDIIALQAKINYYLRSGYSLESGLVQDLIKRMNTLELKNKKKDDEK